MTAKRTTQSVTVTVDRELVNRARDAALNQLADETGCFSDEYRSF